MNYVKHFLLFMPRHRSLLEIRIIAAGIVRKAMHAKERYALPSNVLLRSSMNRSGPGERASTREKLVQARTLHIYARSLC